MTDKPDDAAAADPRAAFKAALERKKAQTRSGKGAAGERTTSGPATQNAKATRMYRRKSG